MEGLETLVASPSHPHTFLLTESAAAAHFNVLSFDTLFKTAATTSVSSTFSSQSPINHNNNNNNNCLLINHNLQNNNSNNNSNSSPIHIQHHQHHHHHHQQQQQQQHHQQHSQHNSPQHQQLSPTNHSQNQQVLSVTSSAPVSVVNENNQIINTTSISTSNHPHLSLLTTTAVDTISTTSIIDQSSNIQSVTDSQLSGVEHQSGDLNTPVTTSGDIPSFFGSSTIVEPPPITGKFHLIYLLPFRS